MTSTRAITTLRIMLVEDNPDHVLLIRRAIYQIDDRHEVEIVGDGARVFDLIQASDQLPDLIFLDINMPGFSGFDVLKQLRADEPSRLIPVVMLTSSEADTDIARAYELGASGYITKPSHIQDMRAILGNTMLYWSALKRNTTELEESRLD
jgi:CheY-like chemotaxis protein